MENNRPLWKHVLAVIAVPVVGLVLLNLTFLVYAFSINGLLAILPEGAVSPGLLAFPALLLIIIGFVYVFRLNLSTGIKGTLATIPLVVTYVVLGMFTYQWPVATFAIGAAVYTAIVAWLLKTKQSLFYVYAVTIWTVIMAVFSLSGGEI